MQSEITTLPNGMRIITSTRPELETVSLGIWVQTGSGYEKAEMNGVSHFLEHMVFKGTPTRNVTDISEQIENVGGQINAYTAREFTAFYAKMLKNDVELAVDVISDILQNSLFPAAELAKEQDVVVQEIKQGLDTPDDIIFDYLQMAAFPDQPIGRTILGPEKIVRSFTADTLNSYLKTNYAAQNTVACAVGKIEHADFVRMISQRFGHVRSETSFVPAEQNYVGGFFAEPRDIEQAHVCIGFKAHPYYDENYYPSMILSTILGGGTSSRLFREIREKRGLVYTVYSFANTHTRSGMMGIYAGTGKEELKQLLPVIGDEISKICTDRVADCELNRAKIQMKASMMMALESSSAISEILARQMLIYNRLIPIEEMVSRIDAVTLDDIRDNAAKIFSSRPSYTLVGALGDYMDYAQLQQLLSRKNA